MHLARLPSNLGSLARYADSSVPVCPDTKSSPTEVRESYNARERLFKHLWRNSMPCPSDLWSQMFCLEPSVLEKILRPIIVYVFLIIGIRLAGKRQLAQLNAFDLVVLLTLANTVQNAIIGADNSVTGGLIGAATLLAMNYVVVRFLYGHQKLDH